MKKQGHCPFLLYDRSDIDLDLDGISVSEAEGPSEVVLADDLYYVGVMRPLGDYDGAFDVLDRCFVRYDITETPALAGKSFDELSGSSSDYVQFTHVVFVYGDVEGTFEGFESQFLFELVHVALLADVVSAFAHSFYDLTVDGYVIGELEYPAVFVVLFLEFFNTAGCEFDPLPSCSEIADDEF